MRTVRGDRVSDLGWTYLGETVGGSRLLFAPLGTAPPAVADRLRLPVKPEDMEPLKCPCGQVHELSDGTRVAYENFARGLGPCVLMVGPEGAWLVPRIYLAAHGGVRFSELPALADRYGFKAASLTA